jgi:hypothetical protein
VPLAALVWVFVAVVAPDAGHLPDSGAAPRPPAAGGAIGFDISYPQCPWKKLPPGEFGIVGLNNGRPFTLNPCVERLYAWAAERGTPSLYLNVAFHPTYEQHLTSWCRDATPADLARPRTRLAWAVGCSEAAYAMAKAPGPARWWWLDIETANSWGGRRANRTAIAAAAAFLRRFADAPVGVYSTERSWWLVTGFGQWNPPGVTANWVGVARGRTAETAAQECGPGFSGMPVTLVQFYRRGPSGTFDANRVC